MVRQLEVITLHPTKYCFFEKAFLTALFPGMSLGHYCVKEQTQGKNGGRISIVCVCIYVCKRTCMWAVGCRRPPHAPPKGRIWFACSCFLKRQAVPGPCANTLLPDQPRGGCISSKAGGFHVVLCLVPGSVTSSTCSSSSCSPLWQEVGVGARDILMRDPWGSPGEIGRVQW